MQGESQAYGNFNSLLESGIDFTQLLPNKKQDDDTNENEHNENDNSAVKEQVSIDVMNNYDVFTFW